MFVLVIGAAGVRNVTRDRASLNLYHLNPLYGTLMPAVRLYSRESARFQNRTWLVLVPMPPLLSNITERWETAINGMVLISPGNYFTYQADFEYAALMMMALISEVQNIWTEDVSRVSTLLKLVIVQWS